MLKRALRKRILEVKASIATNGISYLWNDYSETNKISFRLNSELQKEWSSVDADMKKDISYIQFYKDDNRCALAQFFKAKIHEVTFERTNASINAFGLCPNLQQSCCEESGFITMRDNWKMNSINTGLTFTTIGKIYQFFISK